MDLTESQLTFLRSLDYLSKDEIKDLKAGYTDIEVLLKPEDLEKFEALAFQ